MGFRGREGWLCRPILATLIPHPALTLGGGTSQSTGGSERQVSSWAELAVTEPLFPGAEMDH